MIWGKTHKARKQRYQDYLKYLKKTPILCFAFWPKKITDGRIIWLKSYIEDYSNCIFIRGGDLDSHREYYWADNFGKLFEPTITLQESKQNANK